MRGAGSRPAVERRAGDAPQATADGRRGL
jgi:hypothetical protein